MSHADDFVWVKIGEKAARLTTRGRLQPGDVVVEDRAKRRRPSKAHVWLSSIGKWVKSADLESAAPVFHDSDYDQERYRRLYGTKEMVANEDLHSQEASKTWYNYFRGTAPNGDFVEGPRPFTSKAERREYCRRFGFEEK